MTKKPKTTKSTKPAEPITEREARAAYIVCEGRRSSARLHEKFIKEGRKTPSLRTFGTWCARHDWVRLAREHDEKVATVAADKIAEAAIAGVVALAGPCGRTGPARHAAGAPQDLLRLGRRFSLVQSRSHHRSCTAASVRVSRGPAATRLLPCRRL